MATLLALGSAIVFGAGDFLGGLASRRAATWAVVVGAQATGLVLLLAALPFLPSATVVPADLAWGAAAGIAGAVAFTQFFRGLSIGPMAVVAPVAAVVNIVLPVLVGVGLGERPATVAWIGVALSFPAVVLVSSDGDADGVLDPSAIVAAVVGGIGFGAFFVFLDQTGEGSGIVPLLAARSASITLLLSIGARTGRIHALPAGTRAAVVGSGVLDMSANVLFLFAVREGLLTLGAVVSSMYPASTIVLARLTLGERLTARRIAGLVVAMAAVGLVAAG